jgi:hypothetical protein
LTRHEGGLVDEVAMRNFVLQDKFPIDTSNSKSLFGHGCSEADVLDFTVGPFYRNFTAQVNAVMQNLLTTENQAPVRIIYVHFYVLSQ